MVREHVCPFWLARIRDPAGDFLEVLDALGTPVVSPRRNTLSQARLTYVFSDAAIRCSAKPPVTVSPS
jgi:mannose/cellobiose epimerase-like protein (N-acyl-D-glucosamine 2-epimerase family)